MKIQINFPASLNEQGALFTIDKPTENGWLTIEFLQQAQDSDYVLFPGCAYYGNRFHSLKKQYPPMYTPAEASADMPITITDVPRLAPDGSGSIQVTTGDVSVPCVGVFSKENKKGTLLFTVQEIQGENLGLSYEKGKITISYPSNREKIYRWPFMTEERDTGRSFSLDEELLIPYKLLEFDCKDIPEFYRIFFQHRKEMGLEDTRPERLPAKEQATIQVDKFNELNWRIPAEFYGTLTRLEDGPAWQPGWIGGGMSSYALLRLGGALEQKRALKTLEHLFRTQTPSGFFVESTDEAGKAGHSFHPAYAENWHLLRKSGDVLYFLFKHFQEFEKRQLPIPEEFVRGTKALADAFVTLWNRYGQFGQFVDLSTGDLVAGGSTSCAVVPAGLALASLYFEQEEYLEVAKKAATQYYFRDLQNGYTTGGPGEILQCPDSESAFALLESLVVLYEITQEPQWLHWAQDTAHVCSSWVMSYNYNFPKESEFGRLSMKTVGTVFANAQNKHSAPGICTFSGDSLYKLFQWTGQHSYLELLKDIAGSIGQYMSTEKRPIYSWDVPKDATLLADDTATAPREKLPQGFICERVNTSDWEGKDCIGGVFKGSCWSEVANLLTLAEVAPLLWEEK